MASQVVSIRLKGDQVDRLRKVARRLGKSQSEMGAQLIEESLRESEFNMIEFKETAIGRQAFMIDSRIKVWHVIQVGKGLKHDRAATAEYFHQPKSWVDAAYRYYEAFGPEIEQEIEDNNVGYERLKQILPDLNLFEVRD